MIAEMIACENVKNGQPSNPLKCALACRVYADLKLDKNIVQIDEFYDRALDVIFFQTKKSASADEVILPQLDSEMMELRTLHKLQNSDNSKR